MLTYLLPRKLEVCQKPVRGTALHLIQREAVQDKFWVPVSAEVLMLFLNVGNGFSLLSQYPQPDSVRLPKSLCNNIGNFCYPVLSSTPVKGRSVCDFSELLDICRPQFPHFWNLFSLWLFYILTQSLPQRRTWCYLYACWQTSEVSAYLGGVYVSQFSEC